MEKETFLQYLKNIGVTPNKTFGQNFLLNDFVLQDIVDAAQIKKNDFVVEVGPGIGNLTTRIAEVAGRVLCIEKDRQFERRLRNITKENKNVKVIYGDVLSENFWDELIDGYKVVANIPYYITGKIIQLFLKAERKPSLLVLLTQKEVAENITAGEGRGNLLGLSVQLYGSAEMLEVVPARDFFPAPKVASAIVKIILDKKPKAHEVNEKRFFKILHAAFLGKRKQLHNTLQNNLLLPKEKVLQVLDAAKIDVMTRPQNLALEDWIRLYNELEKNSPS